jgi:hypothetical protein
VGKMGYAYIVTFQADELDLIEIKVTHKQLVEEVNVAVVNLCVNPAYLRPAG